MIGLILLIFLVYFLGMGILALYQYKKKQAYLEKQEQLEREKEYKKEQAKYRRQQKKQKENLQKIEKEYEEHPERFTVEKVPFGPGGKIYFDDEKKIYLLPQSDGTVKELTKDQLNYQMWLVNSSNHVTTHYTAHTATSIPTSGSYPQINFKDQIIKDNMYRVLDSMRDNISINPETFKGFLESIEKGGIDK